MMICILIQTYQCNGLCNEHSNFSEVCTEVIISSTMFISGFHSLEGKFQVPKLGGQVQNLTIWNNLVNDVLNECNYV